MKGFLKRFAAVVVLAFITGCGGSNGGPAAPSTIQVAGLWRGPVTISSVTGGECVGAAIQTVIGSASTYTIAITQTGSSLTARSTEVDTGLTCDFTGTAGQNSVTLNTTRCDILALDVICPNGARRTVAIQASSMNATVNGNSATGTYGETYNVTSTLTGAGVGLMVINGNLSMTRQ